MSDYGTFNGLWLSDDHAEVAVQLLRPDGTEEIYVIEPGPDDGSTAAYVTGCCVAPESLESGWTYFPPQ